MKDSKESAKPRLRRSRREKHLTNDEALALMRAALDQTDKKKAERDYALFAILLNTGLRILEATKLRFEDFNFERRTVLVNTAKQKYAVVDEQDIPDGVLWTVDDWSRFLGRREGYLFAGAKPGTHLTTRAASGIYYTHAATVGLDIASKHEGQKGRGIHSTRHHYTSRLLVKGSPLQGALILRQRSADAISHYGASQQERMYVEKAGVIHGS